MGKWPVEIPACLFSSPEAGFGACYTSPGADVAPHRIEREPAGRRRQERAERGRLLPAEIRLQVAVEIDRVIRVTEDDEESGPVDHLTHEHPRRPQTLDELGSEPLQSPRELGRERRLTGEQSRDAIRAAARRPRGRADHLDAKRRRTEFRVRRGARV